MNLKTALVLSVILFFVGLFAINLTPLNSYSTNETVDHTKIFCMGDKKGIAKFKKENPGKTPLIAGCDPVPPNWNPP